MMTNLEDRRKQRAAKVRKNLMTRMANLSKQEAYRLTWALSVDQMSLEERKAYLLRREKEDRVHSNKLGKPTR